MAVVLRVLGPLSVEVDGVPVVLGGNKQRTVLALLLIEASRVVSAERLIDGVWGEEASDTAGATLQVYISSLRRLLAPASPSTPQIVTRSPGYTLDLASAELDLLEFERECSAARRKAHDGRIAEAGVLFGSALDRWRGPALADIAVQPWVTATRARLDSLRLTTIGDRIDVQLSLGLELDVVSSLEELCATHPLDERFAGQLMIALYRIGRQADALGACRRIREQLLEELGLDPSPALRELESRILRQDPSLTEVGEFRRMERQGTLPRAQSRSTTVLHSSIRGTSAMLYGEQGSWSLERSVTTIGRRNDRDIVVADVDVSRHHAEIRRVLTGHFLVDVGSGNGTSVNGERITSRALSHGDVIRIGRTSFEYRSE